MVPAEGPLGAGILDGEGIGFFGTGGVSKIFRLPLGGGSCCGGGLVVAMVKGCGNRRRWELYWIV